MNIYAVIFDMDGLMFDTERIMAEGWKRSGREAGLSIGEEFLRDSRGAGPAQGKVLFERIYGEGYDFHKIRQGRVEFTRKYLQEHGVPVKKGLRELLEYLKQNGVRIILATSTSRELALSYLEETGVKEYFDGFVCGDMVKRYKPDPESFYEAAKLAGCRPDHCVVLEDSYNGIKAAAAGRFIPVMVPDMAQPDQELSKLLAAKCDSLLDVISFLEAMREKGDGVGNGNRV